MRTFIVTGATGFLGKAFVNWLLRDNEKVIVIVRDKFAALDIWNDRVEIIERDLADVSGITPRHLQNAKGEIIFVHFAWDGTSGDKRSREITQLNNVRVSCEVIRRAKELGCTKFINAGSIMEYEAMKSLAADGIRPPKNSLYSIAKMSADFMLKTIASEIKIDYLNVIISNIYGPGEMSERFLNTVIHNLLENKELNLTEGHQLYDFIYIDDSMRMIKAVATKGVPFESYYIGNSYQRPLREFVIEAKKVLKSSSDLKFGAVPFLGQAVEYNEFDCKKMQKMGIVPCVSFAEGVQLTADSIKR